MSLIKSKQPIIWNGGSSISQSVCFPSARCSYVNALLVAVSQFNYRGRAVVALRDATGGGGTL
jgi:hypothetical protein